MSDERPDISIVTIAYNDSDTIQATIDSVAAQQYGNIQHVIKDGESTDGTVDVIQNNLDTIDKWVSKPDDGLFDALNKGIQLADGELVGILHADDLFFDETVVGKVVDAIESTQAQVAWGDLMYVDRNNTGEIVRYWESSEYRPGKFARGWMPPHLTFFAEKSLFEELGYYDTRFRMAADYELMMRFLKVHEVNGVYASQPLVKMRTGGVSDRSLSNLPQILRNQWDCYRAWRAHGLSGGIFVPIIKPLSKLPQSFETPPEEINRR